MREVFGCDGPPPEPWTTPWAASKDGYAHFEQCPSRMVTEDVWDLIRAWRLVYSHGIWPVAGGQDDQAACFLEVVDILDAERAAYETREVRRSQAQSAAQTAAMGGKVGC